MNKKMLTTILAVVLIGCFFLPYVSFMGMSQSGFDSVKAGGNWENYIPALIPLSGIMLLIGSLNNGNYPGGRAIWAWLPLVTCLYMIIRPVIDGAPFGAMIKLLGVGFWITLVAALVLAFYNPKE
jgi:hypothetical protein